ncbi:MAG: ketoacyl-ACP synthase III [Ruminococcaceae bacterium]|nr:ketoacyl-ACP synthase III [Oscillospiraceae bacterium]
MKAKIVGGGYYLPDRVLTNADLEQMVDTSDEWIVRRTGIKERRIADNDVYTSDMAFYAARKAIDNTNINPEDLDLIIIATCTPDMYTPNVSCMVQARLGAVNAAAFDISSACTGFISALTVANQFIATGYYKKVLVVGAENLSRMTDYKDRNTCVLFGDGAGAFIFEASEDEGVLATEIGADGVGGKNLTSLAFRDDEAEMAKRVSKNKQTLWMDGSEVLKFAVRTMVQATFDVLEKAGLSIDDVDMIVPHQANIRIIDGAVKRLGIDSEKVFVNIEKYGNMSSACIPIALCEAIEQGKIKKGDTVVLVGFGGGLTWGSAVIKM